MATSNLIYTFGRLYGDAGEYIGVGRDPTGTTLTAIKRRVNDAYRIFLDAYDWSFKKHSAVLTTQSDKWFYELPADFLSLSMPFKYPADSSWINPTEIDESTLMSLRTGSGDTTGRPYLYAIRARPFSKEEGTRWEVLFHYTPSSNYDFIFSYRIATEELVGDNDVPIGASDCAALIRAYCLAEAEAFDEEKPSTYTAKIPGLLAAAIKNDSKRRPRSVGSYNANIHGYERRETVTYEDVQY